MQPSATLKVGKVGKAGPMPGDSVTVSGKVFVFVDPEKGQGAFLGGEGGIPVLLGKSPGESCANLYRAMHGVQLGEGGPAIVTHGLGQRPFTFSLGLAYPEITGTIEEESLADKASRLLRQPRRKGRAKGRGRA